MPPKRIHIVCTGNSARFAAAAGARMESFRKIQARVIACLGKGAYGG